MIKDKKAIKLIIVLLLFFLFGSQMVFANTIDEKTNLTNEKKTEEVSNQVTKNITVDDLVGRDITGGPTVEDLSNKLEKKGFEVVLAMQKVVNPILVICLIVAFVTSVFGFISGMKHMIGYGIGALLLIGFVYIGIMFAPEILDFFANFMIE